MIKTRMITDYVLPAKIIEAGKTINENSLLREKEPALSLTDTDISTIKSGGHIILDFEKEYSGGIRILTKGIDNDGGKTIKIRIRFGESIGEANAEIGDRDCCNDHSPRDFECALPFLSDLTFGNSGFRYARIDNIDKGDVYIKQILLAYQHIDVEEKIRFRCDDELVNKIYDYSLRTAYMCAQNGFIYDGIKRDRLVWCGDMAVEIKAYLETYGDLDVIKNSLDFCEKGYPLPAWINTIPSYSMWWIINVHEYYIYTKDTAWLMEKKPYLSGIVDIIISKIEDDGNLKLDNEDALMTYFIDWPTAGTKDVKAGVVALAKIALEKAEYLFEKLNLDTKEIKKYLGKLRKAEMSEEALKGLLAIQELAWGDDLGDELTKEGDARMSTFMAYHIFKAMGQSDKHEDALEIMKQYYGTMIEKGATTFFEDFQPEWAINTIGIDEIPHGDKKMMHGDFGRFCYPGFRLSLCHGWASGPAPFLVEEIAGLSLLDNDKVLVKPHLGNLKYVEASIMTKYGEVSVSIKNDSGSYDVEINSPKEVTIIR